MTDEWVKPGAEVVSVRMGQNKAMTRTTIARVGKMWIMLENGEKFHKLGLDRGEGPVVGGQTYRLYHASDPKVKTIELDIEVQKIMKNASDACKAFVADPSVENAERVVLACLPYTPFVLESNHEDEKSMKRAH